MAAPVANPRNTRDDDALARLAIPGDGLAFAELYDRHEQRVYGFCMRMLRGPHDAAEATQETFVRMLARMPALEGRELNFVAYTLATARNVCYDMIRARRTVEPVDELPQEATSVREPDDIDRDPERFVLLAAAREEVRIANAALPARQREVLALRELEQLSYDEIGELMGLNRNAVAQLISRARIGLRELMRGGALASVGAQSPDCERALAVLAADHDRQRSDPTEHDWMRAHLADCESCRVGCIAMEEAGASYRALGPLVPLAWLRHATVARAAEFVGADWSHIARASPGAANPEVVSRSEAGVDAGDEAPGTYPARPPVGVGAHQHTPRRLAAAALATIALCAAIVLAVAGPLARDVRTLSSANDPAARARAAGSTPQTPRKPARRRRRSLPASTLSATAVVALPHRSRARNHTGTHDRRPSHAQHKLDPRHPQSTPSRPAAPIATTPTTASPTSTPPAPAQSTPITTTPSAAETETTTATTPPQEAPGGSSTLTTPAGPRGGSGPGLIP